MSEAKDRYQIKETTCTLSFSPFYHYRSKLKWYVLFVLVFAGLSVYWYEMAYHMFLGVSAAFLLIMTWFLFKEMLFYIPTRYVFDRCGNAVYQSNLFGSQRQIMNLDEVIIFQSSEMGSWQYKMGKRRSHFLKSYAISEYFYDSKNNNKRLTEFELDILKNIEQMIQSQAGIERNEKKTFIRIGEDRKLNPIIMNRIYFLLVFMTTTFFANAQQYQLDSVVHHVKGAQFIASQKYDAGSKTAEIIRYERGSVADAIQEIERTKVTYDENGNVVLHVFSVWNAKSKSWDEVEKVEKEYGFDNKLVRGFSCQKRSNGWVKDFENINIYAQDSIIEVDYELKEDKFLPVHKSNTVVNSFGKVISSRIFKWNEESKNWQQLIQTTNRYQSDTTMIGFETLEWENNQWQKKEKVVYKLDANNLRTEDYTLYHAHKGDWIATTKFEEEILSGQNKKISHSYRWSQTDARWIASSKTEVYLNEDGKIQDMLYWELDSPTQQLKLQLEQVNLYDEEGRLTLFQKFDNATEDVKGIQNAIKFDTEGNIVQETLYERDVEHDSWIDKITTEFLHDKSMELGDSVYANKGFDIFGLNEYHHTSDKYATKQVKIYKHEGGAKILQEEFEFFYTMSQ